MDSADNVETLHRRIQSEYWEMPDLKLTLWQAIKLWNAPREICEAALGDLVRSGFLYQRRDGQFLRRA